MDSSTKKTDTSAPPTLPTGDPISEALREIPEGQKIDKYFGITTGKPQQSADEAERSQTLITALKELSEGGDITPSNLMAAIASHNEQTALDPNLLRKLMGYKE